MARGDRKRIKKGSLARHCNVHRPKSSSLLTSLSPINHDPIPDVPQRILQDNEAEPIIKRLLADKFADRPQRKRPHPPIDLLPGIEQHLYVTAPELQWGYVDNGFGVFGDALFEGAVKGGVDGGLGEGFAVVVVFERLVESWVAPVVRVWDGAGEGVRFQLLLFFFSIVGHGEFY